MRRSIHKNMFRLMLIAIGLVALQLVGCTSGAKKGGAIGGAVGAATGAVIGHQGGRTGTGAVVGGAVGAAAGAIIGDYMERQKKELEKIPGADVQREGDRLVVTFAAPILFDFDSSALKVGAKDNLQQMSTVLIEYPDTNLIVIGHTDNVGSDAYNLRLSDRRATAVKSYLVNRGVPGRRLSARGYGETAPVTSNSDEDGRAKNRRVAVHIAPSEKLERQAEEQARTSAAR